jgi:hypothetical protein
MGYKYVKLVLVFFNVTKASVSSDIFGGSSLGVGLNKSPQFEKKTGGPVGFLAFAEYVLQKPLRNHFQPERQNSQSQC